MQRREAQISVSFMWQLTQHPLVFNPRSPDIPLHRQGMEAVGWRGRGGNRQRDMKGGRERQEGGRKAVEREIKKERTEERKIQGRK